MTDTRPLNVRVAEALGWTQLHRKGHGATCPALPCGDLTFPFQYERWAGRDPRNMLVGHEGCHDDVPLFGEDSPEGRACTLSLVCDYGFWLIWDQECRWHACIGEDNGGYHGAPGDVAYGRTAPEAVALLILSLAETRWREAGRLPK